MCIILVSRKVKENIALRSAKAIHNGFSPGRAKSNTLTAGMLAIVFAMSVGTASAGDGSFEQRAACEPDVFRLCVNFIPDRTAITGCLQRNKPRLNPDCRALFDGKLK
jgi:hypothetical protein